MLNDLLLRIKKKKRHSLAHSYSETGDTPVIFSFGGIMKKSFYKIGHDLRIKKVNEELKIKPKESPKESSNPILLAKSLNIGYYLITPLLIGVFFGYWLDNIFKTRPLFLLMFFLIGTVGSFYNLWKLTKEVK
jgi:ATP synthase protein I